ncbi:MAG: methyltransferase domain-containing protein [Nanoarchaeota archaeon]|nr:methyltransferase domain-containing protein [Nanoarchaeota archaeon]
MNSKIRTGDKVLLARKASLSGMPKNQKFFEHFGKRSYIVIAGKDEFHCQYGKIDLKKMANKNYGTKVKTHLGEEFIALKPNIVDLLRKARRGPQVVLAKDAAQILAVSGAGKNSLVVDAGSGSGFLAIFLANFVKKVFTYENRKEFFEIAKQNIKFAGAKNIEIKNRDVSKGFLQKDADLVTLDMEEPDKAIKHAHKSLNPGGWLAVYSPTIEHASSACAQIRKLGFTEPKIVEISQREWRINIFDGKARSRPRNGGIFTGFLAFARKM